MEFIYTEARACAKYKRRWLLQVTRVLLSAIFVFIAFSSKAHAGQATLTWNASSSTAVIGYRVYYGTSSGRYTQNIDAGNVTTVTVGNLTDGQIYYFAAKAYDVAGNLSGYSNETSTTVSSVSRLTVTIGGTGGGSVNSSPAGIACSAGNCYSDYGSGTQVTLLATPDSNSTFAGWSGACTNTSGDCTVTLSSAANVAASFNAVPFARIQGASPAYFSLLESAYNAASSGSVIQATTHYFSEDLLLNKNIAVTIEGGYDSTYATNTGYSTLHGSLTIGSGTLTAENLVIE